MNGGRYSGAKLRFRPLMGQKQNSCNAGLINLRL
jgi:hypothetical protein